MGTWLLWHENVLLTCREKYFETHITTLLNISLGIFMAVNVQKKIFKDFYCFSNEKNGKYSYRYLKLVHIL